MTRVVMFVLNDCRTDSRVLREAATLSAAGHRVTVMARTTRPYARDPEREERDGFAIVHVPVAGGLLRWVLLARTPRELAGEWWAALRVRGRGSPADLAAAVATAFVGLLGAILVLPVGVLLAGLAILARRFPPLAWLWGGLSWRLQWRFGVSPWAAAAAAEAPPAEILHAHDLRALPAALRARERRGGRVVYDSHEIFVEAGANAQRPAWAKRSLRRLERRFAAEAVALVTVNDELAAFLGRELHIPRTVVVRNCPPRWDPPPTRPSLLRAAIGTPPGDPIILYHGALAPGRGLAQLAAALGEPGLERAQVAILGFGPLQHDVEGLAARPASGGRFHVLAPVPPDALPEWIASADVVAIPIQPTTLNHRLSTPNKLFEALAAGVPVVASDFPPMRRIVLGDPSGPLGEVCDPTSPADVARALARVLDRPADDLEDLRRRCLEAAHARWNWETEGARLLELYRDLEAEDALAGGSPATAAAPRPQAVTFVLPTSGEYDSRTRRLATSLAARGHTAKILARAGPGLPREIEDPPGVRFIRVAPGRTISPPSPNLTGPGRLVAEASRIVATARRVRAQTRAALAEELAADRPPDLYHAMGFLALPVGLQLARAAQVPLVYDARDIYAESNNVARLPRLLQALFRLRERSWARRAARVFTVNDACADHLARSLGVERPAVVLNGQPDWTAQPGVPKDPLRRALGLPRGTPVVLYHGGFMQDRGLPQLVAAMRMPGLEEAHLVLLGAGVLEPELRRLAAEPAWAGRVHILPPVPPNVLPAWVASADVGAMPNQPRTLNERLSTPNKLFECLAVGTPVVSADFPARRQIVMGDPDGPLGAVCDPTDPGAIALALRSILELEPASRAELRARCLRAARGRYGWERQLQVVLREYERLTGRAW